MKLIHRLLIVGMLGSVQAAGIVIPAALAEDRPQRLMSVTGEGAASAVPDTAILNLGVMKSAPTAHEALDQANTAMSNAIDGFKKSGIAATDLQTSGFSVSPQLDYSDGNGKPPKLTGYQVSNTLMVKVRDISKLGTLLDNAITGGLNSAAGLSFMNSNENALMAEARKSAVKDALAKAKDLAEAAGLGVGAVVSIAEDSVAPAPGPVMRMTMAKVEDAAVPVEAGQNEYRAHVSVTVELVPAK